MRSFRAFKLDVTGDLIVNVQKDAKWRYKIGGYWRFTLQQNIVQTCLTKHTNKLIKVLI